MHRLRSTPVVARDGPDRRTSAARRCRGVLDRVGARQHDRAFASNRGTGVRGRPRPGASTEVRDARRRAVAAPDVTASVPGWWSTCAPARWTESVGLGADPHAAHRGSGTRGRGARGRGVLGRGAARGRAGVVRGGRGRSTSSRNSSTAGIGARRDGAHDPTASSPATRTATTDTIPTASRPAAPLARSRIPDRGRRSSASLTALPAPRRPHGTTRSQSHRRSA